MPLDIATRLTSAVRQIGRLLLPAVAYGLFLTTAISPSLAVAASSEPSKLEGELLEIHPVVHFIGLGDIKPNLSGNLRFSDSKITFVAGDATTEIPMQSIVAFSIEHDTVPLIKGKTGQVAAMAPYGAGQTISMIRNGVDTFTLVYKDSNQAIHGTVFLLPKDKGDDAVRILATFGVAPHEYPRSGTAGPIEGTDRPATASSDGKPSLEVALLTESVDRVPAAFPVGIYEELIAKLGKSGMFSNVWRQGDKRIDANALVLNIDIQGLKKGNERTRSLVPFWGSTTIKTNVELTDRAQNVLLKKQVSAAVRFHGENMEAGHGLCKKVEKQLKTLPTLQ